MTDRPILFSGPMVRAILDGRKTQTRRMIRPQPTFDAERERWSWEGKSGHCSWSSPKGPQLCALHYGFLRSCPYGQPGDRLWVRETWAEYGVSKEGPSYTYRATHDRSPPCRWKPSIHMPRNVSRITLEIVGIRVERLQGISEADAKAEGLEDLGWKLQDVRTGESRSYTYRDYFSGLWDSINEDRAPWHSNPWVWVVEFRRA